MKPTRQQSRPTNFPAEHHESLSITSFVNVKLNNVFYLCISHENLFQFDDTLVGARALEERQQLNSTQTPNTTFKNPNLKTQTMLDIRPRPTPDSEFSLPVPPNGLLPPHC